MNSTSSISGVIVPEKKNYLVITKADGTQDRIELRSGESLADININEYLEAGREFITMYFETVEEPVSGTQVDIRDIAEAKMMMTNYLNIEGGPDQIEVQAAYDKWVKSFDLRAAFVRDFVEKAAYDLAGEARYDKNEFFNRLNSFSSLKEFLESYSKKIKEIKKFSTKDLVEELIGRGGVETFHFDPQQIYVIGDRNSADHVGPATVLEVID